MILNSFPDRTLTIDNVCYHYFGGTSYLGLATDSDFQNKIFENIKKWGTAYGSSRNSNIQLAVFEKSEARLAHLIGAEAVLTLSSGTMAGKLVLEYLEKDQDHFFHYPKTHPAIIHKKSELLFVDGSLHRQLVTNSKEKITITVDAILSAEVEPTAFDFLNNISTKKELTLIIDESHSIGLLGPQKWGLFADLCHLNVKRIIMISSLSKALGSSGGLIASDLAFIQKIRNQPSFVGSSAMNPAYLSTIVESEQIIYKSQQKLSENLDFLNKKLSRERDYKFNSHYPVIYLTGSEVYPKLKSQKIIISSFKYPSYEEVMNRIVITSHHTHEDLEHLAVTLNNFKK